jgi:hypothetical protein
MGMHMENYVVVATYASDLEAHLAQATLAAAEITSFVRSEDAPVMFPNVDYVKGVKLLVDEADLEEATVILTTGATPDPGS